MIGTYGRIGLISFCKVAPMVAKSASTPEPSVLALLVAELLGFGVIRRVVINERSPSFFWELVNRLVVCWTRRSSPPTGVAISG